MSTLTTIIASVLVILPIGIFGYVQNQRPNIIVIIADDMGWNDVSFHGSNQIPTPNIDALAYNGVILNRHYVQPTCTPSRAAFLTGRYPLRSGMQGLPLNVADPRGLPLDEVLLPEYLRKLGYSTSLVGKWHLGYHTPEYTPSQRGFDEFVGFYGGYVKYFNHSCTKNRHNGYDLHRDQAGKLIKIRSPAYFTDLVTQEAERIITKHDSTRGPLFLEIAHGAVHASEGADRLEVPNHRSNDRTFRHIADPDRRRYAGMVRALDESVGRVAVALKDSGLLANSVLVFFSDNGAPTSLEPFNNAGSNFPFRGLKTSMLEGGVRVPAFIFSPLISRPGRVSSQLFHVTDWLPTLLLGVADGDPGDLTKEIDGFNQWTQLTGEFGGDDDGPRSDILLNIDEVYGSEGAILAGRFKYVNETNPYNGFFGDPEEGGYSSPRYNFHAVLKSPAWRAINRDRKLHHFKKIIRSIRDESTVKCRIADHYADCFQKLCFYDLQKDPCETRNLADDPRYQEIIQSVQNFIQSYRKVLKKQVISAIDPEGYPEKHGGWWMPWLDRDPPPGNTNGTPWGPDNFCEGYPVDDPRNCL